VFLQGYPGVSENLFGRVILQGLENPVGILVKLLFLGHTYKV